jgi:hypothetical protein
MVVNLKKLLWTAATVVALIAGAGMAAAQGGPPSRDSDRGPGWNEPHAPPPPGARHNRPGWNQPAPPPGGRDRYWQPRFHGYVPHDRVYGTLRGHGYRQWDGEPYWYRGRYVVRSHDRRGRTVFVEINPYTADFIGIIKF